MSTPQEDQDATRKALGDQADNFEVYGGGDENGNFTGIRPKSRQQKRAEANADRVVVSRIVLYFENGHVSEMDISKVNIVDRITNKPLFDIAIEGEAKSNG